MKIVGRRLHFLMSLMIVSVACSDGFPENVNAPDVGRPLLNHSATDCSGTPALWLHPPYNPTPPYGDGPESFKLSASDCAKIQDVVTFLKDSDLGFVQGIGEWAEYFYKNHRFSKWSHVASHSHTLPGGDINVLHTNELGGSFTALVADVCHEVVHSDEWGITHDTHPSNFDIEGYCTGDYDPDLPPPPPPPPCC